MMTPRSVPASLRQLLVLLPVVLSSGCNCEDPVAPGSLRPETDWSALSITQGIAGHVWFWEGNFEPGAASGTVTAVSRWILVYPLVSASQKTYTFPGGFISEVRSTPVDSVLSDATGFYQIPLKEGEYSLFVRENGLWYFNGNSDVLVLPDSVSRLHININYRAVW